MPPPIEISPGSPSSSAAGSAALGIALTHLVLARYSEQNHQAAQNSLSAKKAAMHSSSVEHPSLRQVLSSYIQCAPNAPNAPFAPSGGVK